MEGRTARGVAHVVNPRLWYKRSNPRRHTMPSSAQTGHAAGTTKRVVVVDDVDNKSLANPWFGLSEFKFLAPITDWERPR
jgi:hypothetical protein